ncbi:MAG TPA: BTAD domain-containing putative transcriptional regulator, partial [Chloroflexota bacterium]|nr:BTAD domain-containing putative transcriptional regulator [Chloroflexota bacterium]
YVLARSWLALGQRASANSALQILKALLDQIRRTPANDLAVTASMLCRLAMIERLLGERDAARATAERGLALAELNAPATKAERQILHHALGTFAGWDGDYAAACEHFEAALLLTGETGDVALHAVLMNAQAGIARCRGESSRALGMLEQALREPLMPPRERAFLTLQTAHVFADIEDFPDAAKHYRLASSMLSGNDRDGVFARALAGFAIASRFLGLEAEADAILEQLRPIADGPSRYDLHLVEGIRAMQSGELAEAIIHFAAARQVPNTLGGSQDTWQAVLLEVQTHLRSGRIDAAEQTVTAYLQSPGATAPAVGQWVVRPVRDCLVNLQRRLNHPGLAALLGQTAVDRRAPCVVHVAKVLDQTQQTVARHFAIHLFGRPEIVVDNEIVSWPTGMRRKAVELFWYSAVHLDGFTREQAIADLFPERDPDPSRKLFLVSAADLRSVLGHLLGVAGDTIFVRDASGSYRLRLDVTSPAIDLDLKALSGLASELRNRRGEPPPREVPLFFRGELLAGLDAEWVDPIRRYWTSMYLRTLETLAARYSRQGLLQHAIRCLELALQVDSTLESAHATLMRLYQAAGDRPALDSQMWLYTRTVRSELDTEPSKEIVSLYRQLTSKEEPL